MPDRLWRVRETRDTTVTARTAMEAIDAYRAVEADVNVHLEVALVKESDTVEDGPT